MSGNGNENSHHPNERAVLYETVTHTKRKVGDFSKLLNGLRAASKIPDIFEAAEIRSGLLHNIVRLKEQGGLFPDVKEHLDWFFENFDCDKAAKGHFEPSRGIDEDYDTACDTVTRIKHELEAYQKEMCQNILRPTHIAKSQWAYINTKDDSKDKYIIELPVSVQVPNDFMVKGKRYVGIIDLFIFS
jgi:DNA mismatch repair protein MSH6